MSILSPLRNLVVRPVREALAERRLAGAKQPGWRKMAGGFWMNIDPSQYWDREAIAAGWVWEPGLTEIIKMSVSPGDTCIDIGGHKGYFACTFAKAAGAGGEVRTFEPDPRAFAALSENIERNGFGWVAPYPIALSESPGELSLSLTKTLGWSSSFPSPLAAPDVVETIQVPMRTLDEVLEEQPPRGPLAFIKLDAEGAEPLIWRGMQETLRRHAPVIAMEVNFGSLRAGGFDPVTFKQAVHAAGYTEARKIISPQWPYVRKTRLTPVDMSEEHGLLIDIVLGRPDSPGWRRLQPLMA